MKSVQLAIITGRKWNAKYAVETAESYLKMKVIGSVATGRAGLGLPFDALPIGCTSSAKGTSAGASTIPLQITEGQ